MKACRRNDTRRAEVQLIFRLTRKWRRNRFLEARAAITRHVTSRGDRKSEQGGGAAAPYGSLPGYAGHFSCRLSCADPSTLLRVYRAARTYFQSQSD